MQEKDKLNPGEHWGVLFTGNKLYICYADIQFCLDGWPSLRMWKLTEGGLQFQKIPPLPVSEKIVFFKKLIYCFKTPCRVNTIRKGQKLDWRKDKETGYYPNSEFLKIREPERPQKTPEILINEKANAIGIYLKEKYYIQGEIDKYFVTLPDWLTKPFLSYRSYTTPWFNEYEIYLFVATYPSLWNRYKRNPLFVMALKSCPFLFGKEEQLQSPIREFEDFINTNSLSDEDLGQALGFPKYYATILCKIPKRGWNTEIFWQIQSVLNLFPKLGKRLIEIKLISPNLFYFIYFRTFREGKQFIEPDRLTNNFLAEVNQKFSREIFLAEDWMESSIFYPKGKLKQFHYFVKVAQAIYPDRIFDRVEEIYELIRKNKLTWTIV